jgi:hypothetical protein
LYALPVCAAPRLVDVIFSVAGGAFTVSDSCTEAVCAGEALSETVTVKVVVPAAVGVPEITPAAVIVNPAGKLPLTDHV